MFYRTTLLDIFETPVTVTPQREISKTLNSLKVPFSRPGTPNQRKGQKQKVHEFHPFLWILVFFFGKTSTIHIELCSGMPRQKVHELAFLWFGLPGWLLTKNAERLLLKYLTFTFGERTFTSGDNRGFRVFGVSFFVAGGFGTPWVGGARRGFWNI